MNGQNCPSTGVPDVIAIDNEDIKYGEKKKMSLTLPLLNVIFTNTVSEEEGGNTNTSNHESTNDSGTLDAANESNKKKKIYESDDTFIQTIFSQTIKSTTATPTEDEPSQCFDAFKQSKSSHDDIEGTTSDTVDVQTDTKTELINQEPAALYTYFHQTIEEDDSPDIDVDVTNNSDTCIPINTLTTTIYTHNDKTQINISTEQKDKCSEKDASLDNSLNNTSTAFASNEAISETEHSLTQLNSLESDVSVTHTKHCRCALINLMYSVIC